MHVKDRHGEDISPSDLNIIQYVLGYEDCTTFSWMVPMGLSLCQLCQEHTQEAEREKRVEKENTYTHRVKDKLNGVWLVGKIGVLLFPNHGKIGVLLFPNQGSNSPKHVCIQ